MKKKLLMFAVMMVITLFSASVYADDIKLTVNGSEVVSQTAPSMINGRVMVPLRTVANALNCDVAWDGSTQSVTIYRKGYTYLFWIGKDHAFKISSVELIKSASTDVPPANVNGVTMIPIRMVGDLFDAEVSWDDKSSTANIDVYLGDYENNEGYAEKCGSYAVAMTEMYECYADYVDGRAGTIKAEIELSDGGVIELELYPDIAPATVSNFIKLAKNGYYNGLTFHRIIKDFMIQGGGFDVSGTMHTTPSIFGEFIRNGYFNLIPHKRGALSMARTDEFNSASGQFFIMHQDCSSIDGNYAAFGAVTDGMDVVDRIAQMPTDSNDKPIANVVIKEVRIK